MQSQTCGSDDDGTCDGICDPGTYILVAADTDAFAPATGSTSPRARTSTAGCCAPRSYGYPAPTALALVDLAPGMSVDQVVLSAACTSSCQVSPDAPTVTGTGFQAGDQVWLTQSGTAPVAGTVTGESGGTSRGGFTVDPAPSPAAHRRIPLA